MQQDKAGAAPTPVVTVCGRPPVEAHVARPPWWGAPVVLGENVGVRILIAPDQFGGALSAVQAAAAMAAPWEQAGHRATLRPMSDGGSGLVEAVHSTRGGELVPVNVPGTLGQEVPAAVLHVPGRGGGTAYIEPAAVLAPSCSHQAEDVVTAGSSAGVADLVRAAVQTGAGRIVIGLGASPTHDGGVGMLRRFEQLLSTGEAPDLPNAGGVADVTTHQVAGPTDRGPWQALGPVRHRLADTDLVVAVAQDTPLLGLHGAGAQLQKFGLSAGAAQRMERRTADLAHHAFEQARNLPPLRISLDAAAEVAGPGAPYTGAGGGVAFMLGLLGARLLPGAQVLAGELGLRETLGEADLVLTGTASLDNHSMHQGVVPTVGTLTAEYGLPVVALAHDVMVNRRELANVGVSAAYPLIDRPLVPGSRPESREPVDPADALRARSARVLRNWAPR